MSRSQGRMAPVILYVKDASAPKQPQTVRLMSPSVASQSYLRQDGLAKQLCPGAGALLAGLGYPDHQDGPPLSIPALPSHLHNIILHTDIQFACTGASSIQARTSSTFMTPK